MRKHSYITITDQFCGAGGSSVGASRALQNIGGGEISLALNHWKLAIDTHNTNFPDTVHECTDISACDPRRYPSTDILITSPECTNHSLAKGQKQVKAQLDLFDKGIIDPACERSRATMWDVPRFAEVHNYNVIIVENVVDARKWIQFPAWLHAMRLLGYNHKSVYLNSMFCHPTPQSRDRMYVVFWKKGNKAPDLDINPKAYCSACSKEIEARQVWKRPDVKWGKYKQQYLYRCPECGSQVDPYYYAAFNAIDWSIQGERIGDKKKPLSENTMRRIKHGLEKYGQQPLQLINYTPGNSKPLTDPFQTCTTVDHHGLLFPMPFIIKGEHTLANGYTRSILETFQTQTVRQSMAVITAFIVENKGQSNSRSILDPASTLTTLPHLGLSWIVEMNRTGEAKPATNPASTITSGGINHAMLQVPYLGSFNSFIHYNYGKTTLSHIADGLGTVTTRDRHSLICFDKPEIENCYYRMLKSHEIQAAMAFDSDYVVLGTSKDKVKQLGNAVTPPAMEMLIDRCIQTLR